MIKRNGNKMMKIMMKKIINIVTEDVLKTKNPPFRIGDFFVSFV